MEMTGLIAPRRGTCDYFKSEVHENNAGIPTGMQDRCEQTALPYNEATALKECEITKDSLGCILHSDYNNGVHPYHTGMGTLHNLVEDIPSDNEGAQTPYLALPLEDAIKKTISNSLQSAVYRIFSPPQNPGEMYSPDEVVSYGKDNALSNVCNQLVQLCVNNASKKATNILRRMLHAQDVRYSKYILGLLEEFKQIIKDEIRTDMIAHANEVMDEEFAKILQKDRK